MGRDPWCRDVVAIYPMLEDNTTWLLAADFDEENWQADVSAFCQCCEELGLVPAVERPLRQRSPCVVFLLPSRACGGGRRLGSGLITRAMSRLR